MNQDSSRTDDSWRHALSAHSHWIELLLTDRLVFSPVLPGLSPSVATNPSCELSIDVSDDVERSVWRSVADGALPVPTVRAILDTLGAVEHWSGCDRHVRSIEDVQELQQARDRLALCAVRASKAVHDALLDESPFQEFRFRLTLRAKFALALGWEAMTRSGRYPLPPYGLRRIERLRAEPIGPLHFVSASDLDAGYYYTLGISLSPEAQALGTTEVCYGLDGELIVPGQAVSPIPPHLALATRLFAAGILTSSNISEEQHSIPIRDFPQPDNYTDLEPIRPGLNYPEPAAGDLDRVIAAVEVQLSRNGTRYPLGAVVDVTGLPPERAGTFVREVLADKRVADALERIESPSAASSIGIFLNVQRLEGPLRLELAKAVVDTVARCALRYLAVTDDVENSWLPGIHEYFDCASVNELTAHADERGVLIIDGRPIDPLYTSSTALQRIQSVMSTLSVDVLKLGMWLTLEARAARVIWHRILEHPAIREMCLMPIGIVEPWSSFVDDRLLDEENPKNARAIEDSFQKIRFMIEEAQVLGMPSLLTDTRHKHHWVLLGAKSGDFPPHPREKEDVTSLLSYREFMECEQLARDANILLGQAGSIEVSQIHRIFSDLTYEAAKDGKNPATAIWTAETERVLRHRYEGAAGALHKERSANIDPFLAVTNRIFEAHARLEGWLRFLIERYHGNKRLRGVMEARRHKLSEAQNAALERQDALLRALSNSASSEIITSGWEACREAFVKYHELVRTGFRETRTRVQRQWERMNPANQAMSQGAEHE